MKHRTCNLPARPGSQYCATHDPAAADRVPCPKDPRHTVRTADLARHLRRCKGQGLDRVCGEPYYSRGANLSPEAARAPEKEAAPAPTEPAAATTEATPVDASVKPLWQHPERVAEVVALLRALAAAPATRGFMTAQPELRVLEYDKAAAVEREMFRSSASAKHGPQVSSIVENMAREGFLAVSPACPVAFVEFGAGKAHLAKVVAAATMLPTGTPMPQNDYQQKQQQQQGESDKNDKEKEEKEEEDDAERKKVPFVLVDRAKFSASTERSCWGQVLSRGVAFSRIQIDITDLVLARVPVLAPTRGVRRVVAFGKHLCGMGCDTALRCVVHARAAMPAGTQFALAIALCCLHRCTWDTYSSPAFLAAHGVSRDQFALLTSIAAWATSGPDKQQQEGEEGEGDEQAAASPVKKCARCSDSERAGRNPYSFAERRELGLLARRLLTEGRLEYLRSNGFPNARVVRYVDEAVSPENVLLLAHTDSWE